MLNRKNEIRKGAQVLLAAVLAASMLVGCGGKTVETTPAEETAPVQTTAAVEATQPAAASLTVDAVTEQGDVVLVSTSYCEVQYPFAFTDLIQVKAVNESEVASLEFVALISGEEHPLFAVRFGGTEGIQLGTMQIGGTGEPVSVWAEIYTANEAALGDSANTYYAAQESFNDVVTSLMENEGFVPAA